MVPLGQMAARGSVRGHRQAAYNQCSPGIMPRVPLLIHTDNMSCSVPHLTQQLGCDAAASHNPACSHTKGTIDVWTTGPAVPTGSYRTLHSKHTEHFD
jgi:hypothetical protein